MDMKRDGSNVVHRRGSRSGVMITKRFTIGAFHAIAISCAAIVVCLAASCSVSTEKAFDAAWKGDAKTVARYLSSGGDANAVDGTKNTLAHAAAYNRHPGVLKVLADAKVPLSVTNATGFMPVHLAAKNNDVESLRVLLDAGVDVNAVNALDRGKGPIHYAAIEGSVDAAAFLLERGVDINVLCGIRATPVNWAAYRSTLEMVKFFVDRGADLSLRDDNGDTAFTSAKVSNREDVVQYFLGIGVTQ